MKYIFTVNEQSQKECLNLLNKNKKIKFIKWLDKGIGLIEYNNTDPFFKYVLKNNCFIRHVFVIDETLKLEDIDQNLYNFSKNKLNKNTGFSFQVRKSHDSKFDNKIIFDVANNLTQEGYVLDVKNPTQIISIYITENEVFLGLGNPTENLSKFKGGEYHFKNDVNFISRAEYKLVEAIDCFNINWTDKNYALDLGAAPGGWSKVLSNYFKNVYAIDPAKLDEKVKKIKNITHYRSTAQEFLKSNIDIKFDALVNDMKMDIFDSVNITNLFASYLSPNADIILTFKLPQKNNFNKVISALNKLSENYNIITTRQLFHNRSEITIWAKK